MAANGIKAIYIGLGCPWRNVVTEGYNSCFHCEFCEWWFRNYDDIDMVTGCGTATDAAPTEA
jgi:hypothetical protein